jgi:hypothetical protein
MTGNTFNAVINPNNKAAMTCRFFLNKKYINVNKANTQMSLFPRSKRSRMGGENKRSNKMTESKKTYLVDDRFHATNIQYVMETPKIKICRIPINSVCCSVMFKNRNNRIQIEE